VLSTQCDRVWLACSAPLLSSSKAATWALSESWSSPTSSPRTAFSRPWSPRSLSCFMLSFFFFSSRRRHTRSKRDWSSDVCSSDLETVFGPACGVGVILHHHGQPQQLLELLGQRMMAPGHVGGEVHRAPIGADEARRPDPDTGHLMLGPQLRDGIGHARLEQLRIRGAGPSSRGGGDPPRLIDHPCPNLGPADVHADGEHAVVFLPPRTRLSAQS